jgi:hypothetical protein
VALKNSRVRNASAFGISGIQKSGHALTQMLIEHVACRRKNVGLAITARVFVGIRFEQFELLARKLN